MNATMNATTDVNANVNASTQYVWATDGSMYTGNRANIQAYLDDGLIKPLVIKKRKVANINKPTILFPRLHLSVCYAKLNAGINQVSLADRLAHYKYAKIASGWMDSILWQEYAYTMAIK